MADHFRGDGSAAPADPTPDASGLDQAPLTQEEVPAAPVIEPPLEVVEMAEVADVASVAPTAPTTPSFPNEVPTSTLLDEPSFIEDVVEIPVAQAPAQPAPPAVPIPPAPMPQAPAPAPDPYTSVHLPRSVPNVQAGAASTAPHAAPQAVTLVTASASPEAQAADPGYTPHGLYSSLGSEENAPQVNRDLEPTISMRHVTKIYPAQPNKPALEDVSLDIYPGEFVFIVGHSGSGKSTFLRLLTRELKVTSGEILVAGQSLTKMRNWKVPFLRRQIGCVFQDFKLLQDRTTYENVAFSLECIGKPKAVIGVQVPEVLRLVGLEDKMDLFPDQLSGGEQQRVSVARAMVNRPPLLICDEPTGNLDPAISLGIMRLLEAINRNGTTVIMATHDREMVDSMRKRVVALENGHLVRDQERGGYGYYGAL